ncbi:hypothetical protein Tco_1503469 [Tanacetum coccineum]
MELLRKHKMEKCDTVTTPMATAKIDADLQDTPTDQTKYSSMIGGLMYLNASRPDIAFVTFPERLAQKTVSKVPDTKDTIKFKLDTQEIIYTVDMFRDTLHFPMETPNNPFITPVNIKVIESFMQTVGYQGVVNKVINRTNVDYAALLWWDFINYVLQKKEVIQYPRFTKLIIADLMKKFPSIPQRLDEDYHSIKDDIPLVSVYSIRNVLFHGMLILDVFLTDEIRATDDYKETTPRAHRTPTLTDVSPQGKKRKQSVGEISSPRKSLKVTIRQKNHNTTLIPPPSDDIERGEIAKATLLSLTLHKTALDVVAQENVAKFVDSMLNDDVDDSGARIEPKSHKENLEVIDDDDVNDKDKQDEKKNDDDQPKDDDVEKRMMFLRKKTMNTTLNLYPTTSSSLAAISTADLQHQLYMKMKSKPQDQAADPEI